MIQGIDFIHICGWMRDLHLTDKQEKLYALIWNVSKSGHGYFFGTAKYIGEWIGCKERHAKNIIRQLEDMGLIQHKVIRTVKKTQTFFWAITPEEASAPTKGSKQKITWSDRALHCPTDRALECPTDRALECPTEDIVIYSNSSNKNKSRCSYTARNTRTTTTDNLSLFDVDLTLPYTEPFFVKAWDQLFSQPAWAKRTDVFKKRLIDKLTTVGDAAAATYVLELALDRGWNVIKNPLDILNEDEEKVNEYIETTWLIYKKQQEQQ